MFSLCDITMVSGDNLWTISCNYFLPEAIEGVEATMFPTLFLIVYLWDASSGSSKNSDLALSHMSKGNSCSLL